MRIHREVPGPTPVYQSGATHTAGGRARGTREKSRAPAGFVPGLVVMSAFLSVPPPEWHCAQPTPALRTLKVCPTYLIIRELTGMPPVVRIGDGPAERDDHNDLHT